MPRILLSCALVGGTPMFTACSDTFPGGDFLNLAAIYNIVAELGVNGTAPADGSTNALLSDEPTVIFNRAMDSSTISVLVADGTCAGTLQVSADNFVNCIGGTVGFTTGNTTFVLKPVSNLTSNTTYRIRVTTAAKDSQGNALPNQFDQVTGFTTAAQPTVSSVTPANGTTSVKVTSTIQFTFNKAMNSLSLVSPAAGGSCAGRSVLLSTDGFSTCLGGTLTTSDNTTFTFTPTLPFAAGTGHAFAVAQSVQDTIGNTMAATSSTAFQAYRPPASSSGGNIQLWLAAGAGVFSDAGVTAANNGDQVQQWNDLSGLNNHALQGTPLNRARYVTGILNGYPTIRFDGTNDFFDLGGVTVSPTATAYTIFIVHRVDIAGPAQPIIAQQDGAGTGRIIMKQDSTCAGNYRIGTTFGGVDSCANTDVATSTFYVSAITSDMTNVSFYNGGNAHGTVTPTIENATGAWRIGATKTVTQALDGDIAEIIFYNAVVNATDRQRVECYLGNKYALAITGHTCN